MAENFSSSVSFKELFEALLKLAMAGVGVAAGSIGSEYCLIWISVWTSKFGFLNGFDGLVKVRSRVNRSFEAIVEEEKTIVLALNIILFPSS